MAKKNKKSVHSANVLFTDEAKRIGSENDQPENQAESSARKNNRKSFLSSLGHGARAGAVIIGLLLAIGALGAGLGDKIISAFTSEDAKQNVNQPAQNNSYLSKLNVFAVEATPAPTPLTLSK